MNRWLVPLLRRPTVLLALALAGTSGPRLHADDSRRLFDFTPVSPANPVVARIDGRIEIPLNELRAYVRAERPHALASDATPAQKRALLDELIGEYLLIDEACRTGVPTLPAFVRRMEATRTMLLTDFMAERIRQHPPASVAADTDAAAVLGDRLFDEASIEVSNEAWALLQQRARLIETTSAASRRGPLVDPPHVATAKLETIVRETPDATLARYDDQSIAARQVLAIYAGLPPPRPALNTHEALLALIKPLIVPELMAREAVRTGVLADPAFRQKVVQNRNTLLRFYMQGVIERAANARLQTPDREAQLQAWYDAHKAAYAVPGMAANADAPTLTEAHARVEADYSVALVEQLKTEKIAALRRAHTVSIDERALASF